jgi:hypothetical protein
MNFYRVRSAKHLRLLGKKGPDSDQTEGGDNDDDVRALAAKYRQDRLPAIKKADARVAKYRRDVRRGR